MSATSPTLLVFDAPQGGPLSYIHGLDVAGNTVTKGVNALAIVATSTSGMTYAYVANASEPNWNTCALDTNCAQLQIVDVTKRTPEKLPTVVKNFKFATSTQSVPFAGAPFVNGTGGEGTINSMFYKNGYLFLGMTSTPSGPELIIMDVHDPLNPVPVGSYEVGAGVDAVFMRNNFVYLATNNAAQILLILDISNPVSPVAKWSDTFPSSFAKGSDFAAQGDTLYFSRNTDSGSQPEFYVLDNADTRVAKPTTLASVDIGQSVLSFIVRDYISYLLVANTMQLRSATSTTQLRAPLTIGGNGADIDCEGNTIYVGTDAGTLSVFTAP